MQTKWAAPTAGGRIHFYGKGWFSYNFKAVCFFFGNKEPIYVTIAKLDYLSSLLLIRRQIINTAKFST